MKVVALCPELTPTIVARNAIAQYVRTVPIPSRAFRLQSAKMTEFGQCQEFFGVI